MKAIDVPSFGECLRSARAAALPRLTGSRVAESAGLQRTNYSRIENNVHAANWRNIYKIIVSAGLGLEHFFPARMILDAAERVRAAEREGAESN